MWLVKLKREKTKDPCCDIFYDYNLDIKDNHCYCRLLFLTAVKPDWRYELKCKSINTQIKLSFYGRFFLYLSLVIKREQNWSGGYLQGKRRQTGAEYCDKILNLQSGGRRLRFIQSFNISYS